jgi:nitrogen PTS system EIIA component
MDDLSDLLSPQAIQAAMVVPNKKALFQQLAGQAAKLVEADARLIVDRLVERERLGSTGFGGGIAIPHGKIDGLDRVVGLFARLSTPIDFAAIDDLPVDLVFLLLSPIDAGVEHLKALARVSRRLRDKAFVAKLRGAGSEDALYALFASGETRHAA